MFYLILYIILYIWLNWKCHCWPSLTDYQVSFTRSIYSEVNGPLEPCCHARSVCCQRTKSLTGGTWNEVERCGTARPATWCIRLGCLPGLRSQCGSGARKPSMRSMHSRRSTGPCQAPKSRKSPKSNTERTTTAKLRLSVFSWNKLNKDQTRIKQWIMNNPNVSSLRITIQVLPSIWQKKSLPSEAAASMQGSPGSDEKWRKTLLGKTPKNFS